MPTLPRFLKSKWTWIVAGALVVLYSAAGFLLAPRLLTSGLHDLFQTRYHRNVELGRVAFNPYTFELTVDHFAVPDADGGPLLGFDRLYVNVGLVSVVRGGLAVEAIVLDAPRVRVVRRPDRHVNLLDLVPPADPAARPDPNARPPRVWIHELTIRGGEASIVDQARRTALNVTLKPISFTLRDFSTLSEGNAYRLAAASTRGETLEWHGTFGLEPLASQGSYAIAHVKAQTISEIGLDLLPLEISKGEFDVSGGYDFAEHGEQLALKARIDEFDCTNLGLRAPGEQDDWVGVARLAVSGAELDLASETVNVRQVRVESPVVTAWRERSGALNLTRLLKTLPGAAPSATPEDKLQRPWRIAVPDIRVAGADIRFEDRGPARPVSLHLAPLTAAVAGFASPATGPLAIEVDGRLNDEGKIAAKGSVTLAPVAGRVEVQASSIGLAALQPYLDEATAMTLKSGTASVRGTVIAGANGAIEFDGDAGIDGLRTVDNALEEDFVKWRSLRVAGIRATSSPVSLRIREVVAREPYARVIIASNGTTNLAAVLAPRGAAATPPPAPAATTPAAAVATRGTRRAASPAAAPPPAPPAKALPVEIGTVRIDNGSMNFADFSIKPSFATGIQELSGTLKGLSGKPDARADLHLEGKVDRYAPVVISGKVNFLAAVAYTDVQMSFRNMELTGLSPYSGKFAGYRIEKGKLSVDLRYQIENRKLNASHKIVVNQLQLGERVESPDATSLPVKLAVALLKDRNGVIDLDLPVTGSLDDPKFRLGPIIWKVVVNLITKIVTSPFALLGSLFGGGEEISYIDFPAGSAALDPASHGKLTALVKALDSRPALNVDLPLVVAPDSDRAALAAARWQADLAARAKHRLGAHAADAGAVEHLLATPKDYRALLEDAYKEAFGHRAEIPAAEPAGEGTPPADPAMHAIAWLEAQLKPRVTVGADELESLARDRAAAVQAALLDGTGIDPGRVFVIKAAPLPAATGPVRMQLSLH